ncbi:hypothetical protein GCM10020220_062430 [Nonomuraea rubra]|uniref:hypothetical protein n=1 Tax=Nonomuraea rubra TaxID=46180 RepID=UPI0031E8BD69
MSDDELRSAAMTGQAGEVRRLLEAAGGPDAGGPDAGGPDAGGPDTAATDTAATDMAGALYQAAVQGHAGIVRMLLEARCRP